MSPIAQHVIAGAHVLLLIGMGFYAGKAHAYRRIKRWIRLEWEAHDRRRRADDALAAQVYRQVAGRAAAGKEDARDN